MPFKERVFSRLVLEQPTFCRGISLKPHSLVHWTGNSRHILTCFWKKYENRDESRLRRRFNLSSLIKRGNISSHHHFVCNTIYLLLKMSAELVSSQILSRKKIFRVPLTGVEPWPSRIRVQPVFWKALTTEL